MIGAIPGLGSAVVDWFAYGYAAKSVKDADQTFERAMRGVIAPERQQCQGGWVASANDRLRCSRICLNGPPVGWLYDPWPRARKSMVTDNLDVTYTMVWSIALANILGAGLCFAFQWSVREDSDVTIYARYTRHHLNHDGGGIPASADWGDLFTLLIFGLVGWTMKHLKWPRPPLILGFVLGGIVEDYMRISYQIYEWAWILKPVCAVMLTLAALSLVQPLFTRIFIKKEKVEVFAFSEPQLRLIDLFPIALLALLGWH